MNVREIVKQWLRQQGYDGLYHPSLECGCQVGDLMPCDEACETCRPGYRRAADPATGFDFLISPKAESEAHDDE